jgi:membrane dipeptidase
MLLWDAHLDLAFNALNANRNLLDPVKKIREKEKELSIVVPQDWGRGEGTVAFPEMRQARVAVSFATLLAGVAENPKPYVDYETAYQAYGMARGQLAYYRALEKQGLVRILTDLGNLQDHMSEWFAWDQINDPDPEKAPPLGFILNMEGADPILTPHELEEWWDLGLRILMLGHFGPGRYTGGTGTEDPLKEKGVELLQEAQRLGMILDLNHFSDQAFWTALEVFAGPVIASHSNSRALVPGQRQLSDEQLRAIIERGGVIGVCADVWMLEPEWDLETGTNEEVTLDTMVEHIDYLCQLTGESRHVGVGTDLDGGFGCRQCPNDLDTIADLESLPGLLAAQGYTETDIENIMYKNFQRLITEAWA